jgi:predicted enzyme related to lactoylglutathione lyase
MAVLGGFPILVTADLPRLEAFYRTALDAERTFVFPGDGGEVDYVTLDFDGTMLGIGREDTIAEEPGFVSLWFYVDDVEDAYRRVLAAGGSSVAPPRTTPWGELVAEVRDPDGFLLYLAAPPD